MIDQPTPTPAVTVEPVLGTADHKDAIVKAMPSLIGAVDHTFVDETGQRVGFILVAFTPTGAVHGSNINPPHLALDALRAVVECSSEPDTKG